MNQMPSEIKGSPAGIQWWQEIYDIWDRPITLDPANLGNMTLRFCVIEALGGGYPGEDSLSGEERVNRWSLATRIKELVPGQTLTLKAEEISMIKGVVIKRWPQTFIVGQIFSLLDPGERRA
jgi:hypothetical protein